MLRVPRAQLILVEKEVITSQSLAVAARALHSTRSALAALAFAISTCSRHRVCPVSTVKVHVKFTDRPSVSCSVLGSFPHSLHLNVLVC